MTTVDTCYVDEPNNRWYSSITGDFFPLDPPPEEGDGLGVMPLGTGPLGGMV